MRCLISWLVSKGIRSVGAAACKSRFPSFVFCCLVMLASALVADAATAAEVVSLENESLRVQWNIERGTLVSLKDKVTDREWIDPTVATPLYEIQLVDQKSPVASTAAKTVNVREEQDVVIIESTHDEPMGLSVTCRFWLDKDSSSVLGRIALRSKVPCRVDNVCFPLVALRLPFSGSGEKDRVLWPLCDGAVLLNPTENSPHRQLRYPGGASMQVMAAFDPAAGVYLASRDHEAHAKMFRTRRVDNKALELSIDHLLPQTPVNQWELGYDVDLAALLPSAGLDEVTWESAADRYRRWALKQPWCGRTAAQRVATGDIPTWLAEPTLLLTFSLRGKMPDGSVGNRLPLLVEQVDRWSKLVGAPVTCLIISWEKLDTWTTPDYFPPYGGKEPFEAVTKQLHDRGHRTMVFLSGLHWTLRKELAGPGRSPVSVDQEAEFDRRGRASAISDAKGEAMISGKTGPGRRAARHDLSQHGVGARDPRRHLQALPAVGHRLCPGRPDRRWRNESLLPPQARTPARRRHLVQPVALPNIRRDPSTRQGTRPELRVCHRGAGRILLAAAGYVSRPRFAPGTLAAIGCRRVGRTAVYARVSRLFGRLR